MRDQRGFSLIEISIATACALLLVFGAATLATQSMKQHQYALGKLDSIQQNSEIKDQLFNMANTGTETCASRMGLTNSSPPYTGGEYELPFSHLQRGDGVEISKLYLADAPPPRTSGENKIYSAQLRVEQKLSRSVASLKPVTLGVMTLTVNSANKIISCNWDTAADQPIDHCPEGAVVGGSNTDPICNMVADVPVDTTCPTKMTMSNGSCIPASVDCWNQALGNDFDGKTFDCTSVPPTYAVRYPANWEPSPPPTSTGTTPIVSGPPPPPSPTPLSCPCGEGFIPAGSSSELCVDDYPGGHYVYGGGEQKGKNSILWHIKRCNSAGQLEDNTPNYYIYDPDVAYFEVTPHRGICNYHNGAKQYFQPPYFRGNCP